MNSFPQRKFEPWQVISSFYYILTKKYYQVLNMLSEKSFLEMEPTMAMMILNNHIRRKTYVPNYENINETKNFDVYYS